MIIRGYAIRGNFYNFQFVAKRWISVGIIWQGHNKLTFQLKVSPFPKNYYETLFCFPTKPVKIIQLNCRCYRSSVSLHVLTAWGESYYRKKTILSSENTLHNFYTHNLLLKKWNIKISLQVLAILEILFTLQKSPDLIYEEKFLIWWLSLPF